jgi:hypothetical protein
MPKSKLRGGAKAHRKRVQARNNNIRGAQRKFQEEYNAEIMRQLEAYKQQMSADTENNVESEPTEQPLNIKL